MKDHELEKLHMTVSEAASEQAGEVLNSTRWGFLWRGLQVVAVASWFPLLWFALSLIGYRPANPAVMEVLTNTSVIVLPYLTLFAALSPLFDGRATRAWVWPSNMVFLVLSIGPAVVCAYLQFVMLMFTVGGFLAP